MKKSKSSSSSKKRKRSPSSEKKRSSSTETRPKRSRARSRSGDRHKFRDGGAPRKTRWQAGKTPDRDDPPRKIPSSDPAEKNKKENPSQGAPLRIKDLLDDKEKIIDHLFLTISGAALQELIPDYLKDRSNEELQKLCLEQIKCMSKDLVLHIISGKESSLFDNPETEKRDPKDEKDNAQVDAVKEEIKPSQPSQETLPSAPAPDDSESLSSDVLELFATSKEMEGIIGEENQVPSAIEKEVAPEPPEGDAELLELEMRARAIRSLLKARSHVMSADEGKRDSKDGESKK